MLLLTKDNKQNIYKGRILRRSMANLISKIIGIGLGLSLAVSVILFDGYKKYNLDGEIVRYNKSFADPLIVKTEDSTFIYSSYHNKDSVDEVYVYPCSKEGCKISEAHTYSKSEKDKEKINEYQKRYATYLNKINLIENKNKQ